MFLYVFIHICVYICIHFTYMYITYAPYNHVKVCNEYKSEIKLKHIIARCFGKPIFSFVRNYQTILHSGCTILYSHTAMCE